MKELVEYSIKVAPEGAVRIVTQCAQDGADFHRVFFDLGFADVIAAKPELYRAFFRHLLVDDVGAHAPAVLAAYLDGLSATNLAAFLDPEGLEEKTHPAAEIHHRSSFKTESGEAYADLLEVLIRSGLRGPALQSFIFKKHNRRADLERACTTRHVAYLQQVSPHLDRLPQDLVKRLLENPQQGPAAIEYLVTMCKLDLSMFIDPEVVWIACPEVERRLNNLRYGEGRLQRRGL